MQDDANFKFKVAKMFGIEKLFEFCRLFPVFFERNIQSFQNGNHIDPT